MSTKDRKPRSDPELRAEKQVAFLAVLAECCQVGRACATVGIGRTTAYRWREEDPEFAEAWDKAMTIGVSALEDEAHRRAFEGIDEPVFYQGEKIDTLRKYSDVLAIFLLKAHAPDKYRENSRVELAGQLALTDMTEEEIKAELAALEASGVLQQPRKDDEDDISDLL